MEELRGEPKEEPKGKPKEEPKGEAKVPSDSPGGPQVPGVACRSAQALFSLLSLFGVQERARA